MIIPQSGQFHMLLYSLRPCSAVMSFDGNGLWWAWFPSIQFVGTHHERNFDPCV
jgi:hypothetical protein